MESTTHPIHVHLVQFQVLDRRPFEVDRQTGNLVFAEEPVKPPARGWKDTIQVNPSEMVRVIAHFGEYEGWFKNFTGEYVWHCHILEHEDNEMMRPFTVRPEM